MKRETVIWLVLLFASAGVFHHAGELLINGYDMLIFGPLWFEEKFGRQLYVDRIVRVHWMGDKPK